MSQNVSSKTERDISQERQIAVFDVCDTLYFSNTTHDFIWYFTQRSPFSAWIFIYRILNSRYLPFFYSLIAASKLINTDILKKFNVSMLSGMSKREINDLARRFVSEFLKEREIEATHEILKDKLASGTEVYLSSSSIEPIVEAVAEQLECTGFFSTSLEYKNEIFQGNLRADLAGIKLEVLEQAGLHRSIVLAVSDNLSDLDLLMSAEVGIAVLHGSRHVDFWGKQDLQLLHVER